MTKYTFIVNVAERTGKPEDQDYRDVASFQYSIITEVAVPKHDKLASLVMEKVYSLYNASSPFMTVLVQLCSVEEMTKTVFY